MHDFYWTDNPGLNSWTFLVTLSQSFHSPWYPLTHLAISVDIDPLIVITQQELHPVSVGQGHDGVRSHRALGMFRHVYVVHTEIQTEYSNAHPHLLYIYLAESRSTAWKPL